MRSLMVSSMSNSISSDHFASPNNVGRRTFVCTDTPEEIAKWIADRKKKYPTDANIHAKELEEQERIARGEVIRGGRGNRGRGRGVTSSRPKEEKVKGQLMVLYRQSWATHLEYSNSKRTVSGF